MEGTIPSLTVEEIRRSDYVIAFMGPTGVGKSYLIELLVGKEGGRITRMHSPTSTDIEAFRVHHPKFGDKIVLVEVPAFDDTLRSDVEVLRVISSWLEQTYRNSIKLTGIIYLHRITDNGVAGATNRNLCMLGALCGDVVMKNVILVSTMWERLSAELGEKRERELKDHFWKPLIDKGSRVDRLMEADGDEAWSIVEQLIRGYRHREALLSQEELVNLGCSLNETYAGRTLSTSLQKALVRQKEAIGSHNVRMKESNDAKLKDELTKMEVRLQQTAREVQEMKIPLDRWIKGLLAPQRTRAVVVRVAEEGDFSLPRQPSSWRRVSRAALLKIEEQRAQENEMDERTLEERRKDLEREREREREWARERERERENERERIKRLEKERENEAKRVAELEKRLRNAQRQDEEEDWPEPESDHQLEALMIITNPIIDFLLCRTATRSQITTNLRDLHTSQVSCKCSLLISQLIEISAARSLLAKLQEAEAQSIVDFLNKVLHDQNVFATDKRKHALHLLSKLAKSAQVFPKCFELSGVECNLDEAPFTKGGFGCIYKGRFGSQAICVKAVQVTNNKDKESKFLRAQAGELVYWAHLSHPNVLPFYGVYFSFEETPRACLVSPWMKHDHLAHYLNIYPKTPRVPLLLDIISGLGYLHESDIVHCDLKAVNVLVSSTERAMLTDFGISRFSATTGATKTAAATGTTHWMAPELLTNKDAPPTFKSDMWSFGCICYEVMTGKIPFYTYKIPSQLIWAFLDSEGHYTPLQADQDQVQCEHEGTNEVWGVAEQCWDPIPEERPSAERVQQLFTALGVRDDRPSPNVDSARLLRARRDRQRMVEIDYDHVHSVLRRVRDDCAESGSGIAKN